jgi:hypothetical protein
MLQNSSTIPTGLISLPLLKYSHATDPSDATKFSWKHELNEVLVVFDNYGADRYGRQPSSIMKVLQGAKLLVRSVTSSFMLSFICIHYSGLRTDN